MKEQRGRVPIKLYLQKQQPQGLAWAQFASPDLEVVKESYKT